MAGSIFGAAAAHLAASGPHGTVAVAGYLPEEVAADSQWVACGSFGGIPTQRVTAQLLS
jgi:hypothetical protein